MSYLVMPFVPAFNTLGALSAGAQLKFFVTETTTPKAVFADPDLTTSLGSVVTADAFGRFVAIYLEADEVYRIRLETALGGLIQEADGITGSIDVSTDLASNAGASLIGTASGDTVQEELDAVDDEIDSISAELETIYPLRGVSTPLNGYGDSITVGVGASTTDLAWFYLFRTQMGGGYNNRGISGGSIKHIAQNLFADDIEDDAFSTMALGFNDMREGGVSADAVAAYPQGVQAMYAWGAVPDSGRTKADAGGAYGGTWSQVPLDPYTFGKYSTNPGDNIVFTTSGRAVYVWFLAGVSAGKVSIAVDGTVYELTMTITLPDGGALAAVSYQPYLFRMGGLADGDHSVTVLNTSASGATPVYVLGWAGSSAFAKAKPLVVASSTLRMSTAGYAGSGPGYDNATPAVQRAYAAYNRKAALELMNDGANIVYVDAAGAWDPTADPAPDNIHPDDSGHASIAAAHTIAMVNRRGAGASDDAVNVGNPIQGGRKLAYLDGTSGTSAHTYTVQIFDWRRFGTFVWCSFEIQITAKDGTMGGQLKIPLPFKVGTPYAVGAWGYRQGVTLSAGSSGLFLDAVVGQRYGIIRESNVAATNLPATGLAASVPTPLILSGTIQYECVDE